MAKKEKKFKGTTRIAAILDASGSMAALATDVLGGYNTWLSEQKSLPDKATLTTLTFDTEVKFVNEGAPIADAPILTNTTYVPRGSTALYDATCNAIQSLRKDVEKGDRALVLVVTDGQENSSKEWNLAKFTALKEELEKTGVWTFVFLSSAPTAWHDAQQFGSAVGNTSVYQATPQGTQSMFANVTASTTQYRGGMHTNTSTFVKKPDSQPAPEPTTATSKK